MTVPMIAATNTLRAVQEKNGIKAEFVFQDDKKRYTASQIGNCIRHRCKTAGIPNKCIHDIRRTVSAKLKLSLPTASVSAILGHTEETNEQFYNPDILSDMVKAEALSGIWNDSVKVLPLKMRLILRQKTSRKPLK